jgi:CRP/FNR family transcriptional regulator
MGCACQSARHQNCIAIVPIFSNLTAEEMRGVAAITNARSYAKAQAIYNAGERREALFVLHTGKVKIYRLSPAGREQVIRLVGPGQFFGELSLFCTRPSTDYAVALEDSTMCNIEGQRLKTLMASHPSIGYKVMEELSRRLEQAEGLIRDIALRSVGQRLAQFLLDESRNTDTIKLRMSKGDLASQLGMNQATLSRMLATFQAQGLIRLVAAGTIAVNNRAGLAALIDSDG